MPVHGSITGPQRDSSDMPTERVIIDFCITLCLLSRIRILLLVLYSRQTYDPVKSE